MYQMYQNCTKNVPKCTKLANKRENRSIVMTFRLLPNCKSLGVKVCHIGWLVYRTYMGLFQAVFQLCVSTPV